MELLAGEYRFAQACYRTWTDSVFSRGCPYGIYARLWFEEAVDYYHIQMISITKRQDPRIQAIRELQKDYAGDSIWVEGPRLLREAMQANLSIQTLILCSESCQKESLCEEVQLIEAARNQAKEVFQVNASVFDLISDVETPQGIAAVCSRPLWSWEQILSQKPATILVLDGIQNPGNLASILRTAEAAGAAGVITTTNSAHIFSPKAIRGAMGSSFRLPSLEHQLLTDIVHHLQLAGYRLVATKGSDPSATQLGGRAPVVWRSEKDSTSVGTEPRSYAELDRSKAWAILLGSEGSGISSEWDTHLQETVFIPMKSPVESLNVGAAAAILLYRGIH